MFTVILRDRGLGPGQAWGHKDRAKWLARCRWGEEGAQGGISPGGVVVKLVPSPRGTLRGARVRGGQNLVWCRWAGRPSGRPGAGVGNKTLTGNMETPLPQWAQS